MVAISAAVMPISSEVRPPYISRTISSRPRRLSAPRKNLPSAPNHCGPIGLPSGVTTSCSSPLTVSCSTVCSSFGPVWATWFAHSGAARTKSDDQDEEGEEGDREAVAQEPPQSEGPGPSLCARLGRHGFVLPLRALLEFEAGQVLAEGRVEDDAFEVDRVGDEGRQGPRPVGRPRRLFHDFLVEFGVGGFLVGPELFCAQLR